MERGDASRTGMLICLLAIVAAGELVPLAWPFQKSFGWSKLDSEFYPKTPLIQALEAQHRGGAVLWLDDVISYLTDQNEPEVQTNRLVMRDLPSARGYDPVNARWIGLWFNLLGGTPPGENPGGFMFLNAIRLPAWLTLMGVETVVSYAPLDGIAGLEPVARFEFPPDPEIPGATATTLTLWRNENYRGRAFAAPRAPFSQNRMTTLALSARRATQATTDTLSALAYDASPFSADPESIAKSVTLWPAAIDAGFKVKPLPSDPNRFRYQVEYPQPALLCLAQSAYDGWTATVDGQPADYVADYSGAFVVASVPEGKHEVEFRFIPSGLAAGRTVSLMTLVVILLGLLKAGRKKKSAGALR